jgi:hypothetical protein
MEITVEELNELLDKARKDALKRYNYIPTISKGMWIPEACRNCSNHPSNGGSGICHCILGQQTIY